MTVAILATALVATALMAAGLGGAFAQSRTRVTLYTSIETDQLVAFKQAIEKDLPEIDINWVRDSTGVITARVLAERENPRADMIFGLAATSLILFARENLLESYKPKGADELKPAFRDTNEPYLWTGMDAYVGVLCFNTEEARKVGAPVPRTWRDLLRPEFRNRIVMPHPASSGTGFLMVAGWLQSMGEDEGWRFMEDLHQNVALYTHSGSAPCVQAARGERVVGLSFDMRGAREKTLGAPLEVIVPQDGAGWEMEAFAIVRDRPSAQAAAVRRIADWAASRRANELYSRFYAVVAREGVGSRPENYPDGVEARMVRNDFAWMAQNRDRILLEWSNRFDGRMPGRN